MLLVCRFSGGDDIILLQPGGTSKDIVSAVTGSQIPGLRKPFANPLDIVEDERTGNLYITEYYDGNGKGKPYLTLLKANTPATMTAQSSSPALALPDESTFGDNLEVYPNPNRGSSIHITAQRVGMNAPVSVAVLDAAGRLVQANLAHSDAQGGIKTEVTLNRHLNQGLYFIKLQTQTGVVRYRKFLVQ
ncbi:T9SS type A sorting domain-containing protein [Pontibacter sp. E15-1]|uniref:T9SS type A sorting domain-containing protein n=1 Tax=Pontibacter sp. E15-1 TaxID=2919918 RepID=UPI001F4FF17D|nr:T9SS type A sorting domain-containing protein [Pontibacter sp. E15-1]MCJ8164234.1 T9SS type A sorting domain-containing protein [Pontibacter sp. E15-1]